MLLVFCIERDLCASGNMVLDRREKVTFIPGLENWRCVFL